MANYQKLQVGTAININPSDDANIPFPNVVTSGSNDDVYANSLICTTAEFVTLNVQVGDVVYNTSYGTSATVTQVVDQNVLLLNADIFTSIGNDFTIYSNNGKEGCVLYIGQGGDLKVLTVSGQTVIFYGVIGGTFLPVQVLKVFQTDTSASRIVALW